MPRSNLNVVAAVGAIVAGAGVLKRVDFVADCTFGVVGCAGLTFLTIGVVGFVVVVVPGAAAGFNIGVLLVAVGVSSSGIFPAGADVDIGADGIGPSSLCADGFGKFIAFSDGLD